MSKWVKRIPLACLCCGNRVASNSLDRICLSCRLIISKFRELEEQKLLAGRNLR